MKAGRVDHRSRHEQRDREYQNDGGHHAKIAQNRIFRYLDLDCASTASTARRMVVWISPADYLVVGTALATARRHGNITQVELARRLEKPQSFISAYEAGTRRVDLVEFLLITRTLGADPVEIFAEIARSVAGGER
jgi:hypothetical protein